MKEEIAIHIREAARQTGVSIRSLRYYEKKRLVKPERSGNGYRDYSSSDVDRIQAIRFYMSLGLGTEEIARMLERPNCAQIDVFQCADEALKLYEGKLREVRDQQAVLEEQEQKLVETVRSWRDVQDRLKRGLPVEREVR